MASSVLEEIRRFTHLVRNAKDDIKEMYLDQKDLRPWAVAWSGGKDSTCVLKLVTESLMEIPAEKRTRFIHVVMSDTVIENPELDVYMRDQITLFNTWAEKAGVPMKASMVERNVKQGYFFLLLGKGYPLPGNSARWCTERLKIKPQELLLKEINPSYTLSGVRTEESASRARSIDKYRISDKISRYDGKTGKDDTQIFMPIVFFTVEDVWRVLRDPLLWSDTQDIRRIYKDATGECGFTNPRGTEKKGVEVCGARFGCWTCPVIVNDRSTEQMALTNTWLKPLTEWRQLHLRVYGRYQPKKPEGQSRKDRSLVLKKWRAVNYSVLRVTKAGHTRLGKATTVGSGTLTLDARKFLLSELLKTQDEVNRLRAIEGLPRIPLINQDELDAIYEIHRHDQENLRFVLTNRQNIPFERRLLLEDLEENAIDDIEGLAELDAEQLADMLVANFVQSQNIQGYGGRKCENIDAAEAYSAND